VYTKSDYVLLLYSATERDWAIGRNPFFETGTNIRNLASKPKDEDLIYSEVGFRVINYDLGKFGSIGHMDYRQNLGKVLDFIGE